MLSSAWAILMLLAADPVIYQGRQVTVVDPGTTPDGFDPKREAKVCVQGQPEEQCYSAPKGIGREPALSIVELRKGEPALFFQAASGGVSGFSIHFALFQFCDHELFPGCRVNELRNLLPYELEVSNESQHAFWDLPDISDSKTFLTADYVWGPGESHYSDHRFIISSYVRRRDELIGDENDSSQWAYFLADQFMTVRSYGEANDGLAGLLAAEKQEILARLRRVKASWPKELKTAAPKR